MVKKFQALLNYPKEFEKSELATFRKSSPSQGTHRSSKQTLLSNYLWSQRMIWEHVENGKAAYSPLAVQNRAYGLHIEASTPRSGS
jgi:hypothetical protein